jgi:hypothetical protein
MSKIMEFAKVLLRNNENKDEVHFIVQKITPLLSVRKFEDVLEKSKLCPEIKKWFLACLQTIWGSFVLFFLFCF